MTERQPRHLQVFGSDEEHHKVHRELLLAWYDLREALREIEGMTCELENRTFELLCGDDCYEVA
jgi:hypothetical protein